MARRNELKLIISVANAQAKKAIREVRQFFGEFSKQAKTSQKNFKSLSKSLLKVTAALFGLKKAFDLAKDITLTTAKINLSAIALENLGRVSGISSRFLKAQAVVIKGLGITTEDTNDTLADFLKTGLDITKVGFLARVAQDAAVLARQPTSKALKGITRGIVTLNSRVLRNHGIFLTASEAAKRYAKELNVTVSSLTTAEKQTALLNEILKEGERIQGTYEASLSSTGKRLLQLDRLWKEAKLAIGEYSQAVLTLAVDDISVLLRSMVTLKETGQLDVWGQRASDSLKGLFSVIKAGIKTMFSLRKAILAVGTAFIAWKIIASIRASFIALNATMVLLEGQTFASFLMTTQILTKEMGLLGAASISTSTAITILGTSIIAAGLAFGLGTIIGSSQRLRDAVVGLVGEESKVGKFFDTWAFGLLKVENLERETAEAIREQRELQIKLNIKQAQKTIALLAEETRAKQQAAANEQRLILERDRLLKNSTQKSIQFLKNFLEQSNLTNEQRKAAIIRLEQEEISSIAKRAIEWKKLFTAMDEDGRRVFADLNEAMTQWTEFQRKKLKENANDWKKNALARLETSEKFSSAASSLFSNLNETLVNQGKKKSKQLFALEKAASIAGAIINTAKAATAALGTPPVGPVSIALAGVITAAGAAQIALISSTRMARGGVVDGQRGGIVNRPTVIGGDGRTSEAFVPLPDNRRIPVKLEGNGKAPVNIINVLDPRMIEAVVAGVLARTNEQTVLNVINDQNIRRGI